MLSFSSRNYLPHFLKHRFCAHSFGQDNPCYLFVFSKIFISATILIWWHIKFPARIPPHFHNIIHQKPIHNWKPLSPLMGSAPTFSGIATKQRLLLGYACEIRSCYCRVRKFSTKSELRVNSADFEVGENH